MFDHFEGYRGSVPKGYAWTFLGTLVRPEHHNGWSVAESDRVVQAPLPRPDSEEYFEMVDVLESVLLAERRYVMVELGAGFGRWAAIAGRAAQVCGLEPQVIAVEGDPKHARWAREHLKENGLGECSKVHESAVGPQGDSARFLVALPDGFKIDAQWYGQSLASAAGFCIDGELSGETYEGRPLYRIGDWGAIDVPVVSLASVLDGLDVVDLVDMDIQGAEADVVASEVSLLNERVKRLHIGTHSPEIEQQLRDTLYSADWLKLRDYKCQTEQDTPFGRVNFVADGLQTWLNPRLN